jgi:succinate dehydrogenase/fumarate reductase flavoprotein subunit
MTNGDGIMEKATELRSDVLVLGAGISGLTVAAALVANGQTVTVVEKAADIGGSAFLSGGLFWSAANLETFREHVPLGTSLGEMVVDGYVEAVDWIRRTGARVEPATRAEEIIGYPVRAFLIDQISYLRRCARDVTEGDGWVGLSTETSHLVTEGSAVVGAVVADRDGTTSVRAHHTVLATGGFQGSPDLRERFIGARADALLVRSNPGSVGDGLRFGLAAGGSTSDQMGAFYGHTVPYPLKNGLQPGGYGRLAQLYSAHCVLLDDSGTRFIDESIGYYVNAQAVAKLPSHRALLIGDARIRTEDAVRFAAALAEGVDRPREAAQEGAHVAEASTLEELDRLVQEWGYAGAKQAIEKYNHAMDADMSIQPPRGSNRQSLVAPYFAIEVQPAITMTNGGLRVDSSARVLRDDAQPVPGLLAVGADGGTAYGSGYGGGLSLGVVTGLAAAKCILSSTT